MEGKRAVKIDFNTKLKIIRAHEEGKSAEDIADELNIPHVVYVERVLEKKHELQALSNSSKLSVTCYSNANADSYLTPHAQFQWLPQVAVNAEPGIWMSLFRAMMRRCSLLAKHVERHWWNQKAPGQSAKVSTRFRCCCKFQPILISGEHDPEPLRPSKRTPKIEVMDFDEEEEQANANSDSSETEDYRSRVDAAANTTFDRNDRSMLAQVQVADMAVSPFRTVKYSKDKGSQTAKQVFYDEEYVAFLKNNHEKTIFNKDSVIDELKRQNFALSQQVDKLQEDLIREREKKGLEGGWKKYF